tara:strand:- start:1140 stop:1373 length:234 start_codon:yes stop_codon:yes gene_type:complete
MTIISKEAQPTDGTQQAIVKFNDTHYLISRSTRAGLDETLIFKCDNKGTVTDWADVGGGRCLSLDEVLSDFSSNLYN